MDISFIAIVSFILLAILFLLLFLFRRVEKESFITKDGSCYKNQYDIEVYESLYEKTKILFSYLETKDSNKLLLGFVKSFLKNLKMKVSTI